MKIKFHLEFLFSTSPKILENKLYTSSGLAEWFCDDVLVDGKKFAFYWDKFPEEAMLLDLKTNHFIKFQWMEDYEDGNECYFEISTKLDPMTKATTVQIVDFCHANEQENITMLWNQQITKLRRLLGA
jgi:hypothetical protein